MNYTFPDHISTAGLKELILQSDRAFETALLQIANQIASSKSLQMIGLTGPTCSGKTTAAKMLTECLFQKGKSIHVISIDDFYFEKSYLLYLAGQNESNTLDYDSEKTIDIPLLAECVSSLLNGKPTLLPHFNFFTGLRECGVRLLPKKGDLFLFEGIQILYPNVSAILSGKAYQSIAICPQSGIAVGEAVFSPNEIRLMRRLVRDMIYRGSLPSFTFSLWASVRENEEKNIFPNLPSCNFTVDSTMPYEISVLKPYLMESLEKMALDDPNRAQADHILQKLKPVKPVDSSLISSNSLYREFI